MHNRSSLYSSYLENKENMENPNILQAKNLNHEYYNKKSIKYAVPDEKNHKIVIPNNLCKKNSLKENSKKNTFFDKKILHKSNPKQTEKTQEKSPKKESISIKKIETNNILCNYSKDLVKNYLKLEEEPVSFLEKHGISPMLRAKMVDWMIEVLSSYKCSEQTFFLSVTLMDNFLKKLEKRQESNELHLIGVSSMLIAGKMEEIYPIKLSIFFEKISHRKLLPLEIKRKEGEIIETLQFKLSPPTVIDFVLLILAELERSRLNNKIQMEKLDRTCLYLSKLLSHDYQLVSRYKNHVLATTVVFLAFKIIEQIDPLFQINSQTKIVTNFMEINADDLYAVATEILSAAKSFEKNYPNLENLKKFNTFSLD